MPDETTSNPEPTNTPVPQVTESHISRPPEAVIASDFVEAPVESIFVSEPIPAERTAQMGRNEPFAPAPTVEAPAEIPSTEATQPAQAMPVIEPTPAQIPEPVILNVLVPASEPTPTPAQVSATVVTPVVAPVIAQTLLNPVREILAKAQQAIHNKKRKKLDSILTLFAKRTNITNDEVEKFLHVSDATATRYLSILEKENKIKQVGKTGKGVSYSKI